MCRKAYDCCLRQQRLEARILCAYEYAFLHKCLCYCILMSAQVFVVSARHIREESYDTLYTLMTRNSNGMVARVVFSVPKPFQALPSSYTHA